MHAPVIERRLPPVAGVSNGFPVPIDSCAAVQLSQVIGGFEGSVPWAQCDRLSKNFLWQFRFGAIQLLGELLTAMGGKVNCCRGLHQNLMKSGEYHGLVSS